MIEDIRELRDDERVSTTISWVEERQRLGPDRGGSTYRAHGFLLVVLHRFAASRAFVAFEPKVTFEITTGAVAEDPMEDLKVVVISSTGFVQGSIDPVTFCVVFPEAAIAALEMDQYGMLEAMVARYAELASLELSSPELSS